MKVLVTGGAGFIGSHLAEALLNAGHDVTAIDNLTTGKLENVERFRTNSRFKLVIDSVTNEPAVEQLVRESDRVYHLAAAVGVKLIMEKPVETIETNVLGTETLLRSANRYGKKILIASTSEIYGKHSEHTLSEDDNRVMGPVKYYRWAYANSKTLDEFLALAYWREKKLPVVIARLFNTVGPRQTGQYGMVVPRFVQWALMNQPIQVYGDGNQRRSFCHVSDVIRALTGIMESADAEGDVFNIGNPNEITMLDLARRVKEFTGSSSVIITVPYAEVYGEGFEDMERRCPNIAKIGRAIGFKPEKTLEDILRDVVDYYKKA